MKKFRNIGFTGSQLGMSDAQKIAVASLVKNILTANQYMSYHTMFHHGDCMGADEEAHNIVSQYEGLCIVVWPPSVANKRAFCNGDSIQPVQGYLERNQSIVDTSDYLIAAPKGPEELRSGTWSTVRKARKKGIPIAVVYPDGRIEKEN